MHTHPKYTARSAFRGDEVTESAVHDVLTHHAEPGGYRRWRSEEADIEPGQYSPADWMEELLPHLLIAPGESAAFSDHAHELAQTTLGFIEQVDAANVEQPVG